MDETKQKHTPLVAYLGNFKHSWTTETHLARDMRNLGLDVSPWQEPDNTQDKYAFMKRLGEWCESERPDVVMFTRTWGLPPEATQMWRRFEEAGIITCSYHLDLYLGLQREEKMYDDPFWSTQFVFTPDGDPKSAERFKELGINHHWISPAVVSDECYIGEWDDRFDFDVVFVGSYGYHDEWPWRPTLIDYLSERYGGRFKRFGGDVEWPKDGHTWRCTPRGIPEVERRPARGRDLNNLYATARVVVGDSLALPGRKSYWSDRYFETLGRGGFLVAPWVDGLAAFLNDGEHYVRYDHPGTKPEFLGGAELSTELALDVVGYTVDYALEFDDVRKETQQRGHEHVKAHHTYKHRLARAFEIMGIKVGSPDPQATLQAIHDAAAEVLRATAVVEELLGEHVRMPEGDLYESLLGEKVPEHAWVAPHPGVEVAIMNVIRQAERLPIFIEKLELGAGYNKTPGFTTLDANPDTQPDIVGPAWPLDLLDESVGELRCVDVLEHISYRFTDRVLADWFRVLASGGKIYVQVPDADLIMKWYDREPHLLVERLEHANGPQTALFGAMWRLLGGHNDGVYAKDDQSWSFNAHHAMFSPLSLRQAMENAGFVVDELKMNGHPNLLVTAHKP